MSSTIASDADERKYFYEQAEQHIALLNIKFREKAVITHSMSEKIITCLRNNSLSTKEFDSRFISWCRNSFVLEDIGVRKFLCDIKTGKPVLLYENMYDIFKKIHNETAHAGRDKCLDSLSINYSWYNRDLLQIFLKNCSSCQKRKSIKRPVVSKPIIALEFMSRIQMDLIDMRTRPDISSNGKTYKWILQLKDHFSKFCWARPLEKKEAHEVYHCVRDIFFMFGPPHILQSDNGREFVNELINSLQLDFPEMRIVHGRPRHPQTQGLIERANAILTDALGKWMEDHSTDHWADGLPSVIFSINTRTTFTTKTTPYQLVFGQDARANRHYWDSLYDSATDDNIVVNDLIIDKITEFKKGEQKQDSSSSIISKTSSSKSETLLSQINQTNDSIENINLTLSTSKIINIDKSRHESHRAPARVNYIKAQTKRQKLYDEHIEKIASSYKNNDFVGISINKVDRTNCDPKVMPCVIEKQSDNKNIKAFYLISPYGRLSTPFPVHQLIPMSGIKPIELQNINYDNLATITLVQASKLFARGNPSATCDCRTRCITKTCPCRRASISCSTKCHAKRGKCSNIDE